MTPWKTLLGIGLACAACCSLPLLAAGAWAAAGGLWAADTQALVVAAALALVLAGRAWRRRRLAREAPQACGCASPCSQHPTQSPTGS